MACLCSHKVMICGFSLLKYVIKLKPNSFGVFLVLNCSFLQGWKQTEMVLSFTPAEVEKVYECQQEHRRVQYLQRHLVT